MSFFVSATFLGLFRRLRVERLLKFQRLGAVLLSTNRRA